MPLDTSIALNANAPQPTNPLATALQVAQYRYMNANSQAQQQSLNANRATSSAYQQAVDPTTGQLDTNKLSSLIAGNPDAAYNYAATMKGVQDMRQSQATLDTTRLDQAQKAQTALRSGMGSLLAKPDLSPTDIQGFVGTMVKAGSIPQQVADAELQSMPQDPAQIRPWLAQHFNSALSGEQQLSNMKPSFSPVNTGPATVAVNQNPNAIGANGQPMGVGSVGYTVQNGLSPSDALSPGITLNNGGQPTTYLKGQLPGAGGAPSPIASPPAQPGGQATPGAQPASSGVPQLPSGGYATAPPMGAQGIADAAGTRYGNLQQAASQAKPLMQTYDLAAQALKSTIAGKGANAALNVPALLNTFGIQAGSDAVKNNQLLSNYLNSAADQAASSLGLSGSDSRLAAAKAGQPDPANMNGPALLESINHVKGLQQAVLDRQQATTNFLAQNGNNTSALPQFETKWNQSFNPDVSYVRSLSPDDQQAALQKLKTEGKLQQWTKDYSAMKGLGAF